MPTDTTEILATWPRGSRFSQSLSARLFAITWRNLWRNKRRTWLTVSGIAFAVWMIIFSRSVQEGTFDAMIDSGARMMPGHVQIQHRVYQEDPRIDHSFREAGLVESLRVQPGVEFASVRAQGFALLSQGERSFGAQVIGIEPDVERQWSGMATMIPQGRYLEQPGEVLIGATLARNLGLVVGDEMLVLGTAMRGGVAALALEVVGIFDSHQPEFNRAVVFGHIADFRDAWGMADDEAHALVVIAQSVAAGEDIYERLTNGDHGSGTKVLGWQDLMPEAQQMRNMKGISSEIVFAVIAIIITFSVVNTFMMVTFERTAEFGMLQAIGMKLGMIQWQLQIEALCISVLGVAVGFAIAFGMIFALGDSGLPIPVPEEAMEMYARMNMGDRLYPEFDWGALRTWGLILLVGVQLAAVIPTLRLRHMRPVDALRHEA